ncbi:MAG: hypothetical protein KGR26_15400 [Cyanobacteria bacterium REEB65]|nr:hypothetical protein [Cyanobacteria bacterium REEB65]
MVGEQAKARVQAFQSSQGAKAKLAALFPQVYGRTLGRQFFATAGPEGSTLPTSANRAAIRDLL